MKPSLKIYFKDWLPDLPALDNPGLLEANNARPLDGSYANTPTAATSSSYTAGGFPQTPWGAFYAHGSNGVYPVVMSSTLGASTAQAMYYSTTTGAWTTLGPIVASQNFKGRIRSMAQYGTAVYVAGQTINKVTEGGGLAEITASPIALAVAAVGQFMVATSSSPNMRVQWSSIGDPDDYPTPGSSTAIARQAGEQDLSYEFGYPLAITGGDQFGIVFQESAIHRMSYVGGSTVFQFDRISDYIGCQYPTSVVKVGDLSYFATKSGFYVTDGTMVRNISAGRVAKYFKDRLNTALHFRMHPGVDYARNLIYWAYPTSAATTASPLCTSAMIYNIAEDRWGHASINSMGFLTNPLASEFLAFEGAATLKALSESATPGTATFVTGDMEANTGGYARVSGVKPLIDATTNAVTVSLGVRNHLADATSYGSATTANSSSGFVDFRAEARYHRAKFLVSGTFNAAQGYEVKGTLSGEK